MTFKICEWRLHGCGCFTSIQSIHTSIRFAQGGNSCVFFFSLSSAKLLVMR